MEIMKLLHPLDFAGPGGSSVGGTTVDEPGSSAMLGTRVAGARYRYGSDSDVAGNRVRISRILPAIEDPSLFIIFFLTQEKLCFEL